MKWLRPPPGANEHPWRKTRRTWIWINSRSKCIFIQILAHLTACAHAESIRRQTEAQLEAALPRSLLLEPKKWQLRLVSGQPTQRRGKQARKPQLRRERPAPCAQEATSSETGFLSAIRAARVTGHNAYHQ
jgi:hypothetical protein